MEQYKPTESTPKGHYMGVNPTDRERMPEPTPETIEARLEAAGWHDALSGAPGDVARFKAEHGDLF